MGPDLRQDDGAFFAMGRIGDRPRFLTFDGYESAVPAYESGLSPFMPQNRYRAGSWAFYNLRDDGILQVICPTCQNVFAGSRMPATARLLCMGLFSIFWLREPRRPCGWPAGPELEAAPAFAQVSVGVAALLALAGTNMTMTAAS